MQFITNEILKDRKHKEIYADDFFPNLLVFDMIYLGVTSNDITKRQELFVKCKQAHIKYWPTTYFSGFKGL